MQVRIAAVQRRKGFRQNIGREGGDHPEHQLAGKRLRAVVGVVHEVSRGSQHVLAAPRNLLTGLGEGDIAWTPLDQIDAEEFLQRRNLHREGRLGDRARLRRPAEMPMLGEGREVTQLPQGEIHRDKII